MSAVKIGGQILDRDRSRERQVLQHDEKSEERESAESAARDQEGVIVPLPIEPPARDLDRANHSRNEATKEDDLHRRDAIELFHEDVHGRKCERGDEHIGDSATGQVRIRRESLIRLAHS